MIWLRLAVIGALGLLVSCIDGREEIWIERDGSGRADVAYSLPASAAVLQGGEKGVRRLLEDFFANSPDLSSPKIEVDTVGDRLQIHVKASFKSALDLKKISSGAGMTRLPASATGLAGTVKIATHGLNLDFSRTISPGLALPGAAFFPASQFQGRSLTYIIHLPLAATESNATQISDEGRTLIWEFPLLQSIQKPVVTHFIAPIPIPRWLWFAGIALLITVGLILHGWRRSRNAKCSI